jgi:hypothetical protein
MKLFCATNFLHMGDMVRADDRMLAGRVRPLCRRPEPKLSRAAMARLSLSSRQMAPQAANSFESAKAGALSTILERVM